VDDNPYGFLVFVVLAIAMTVAGKVSEYYKRKKREEDLAPTRVEDLPEATRRTIYGDQGPGGGEGHRAEVPSATREIPQETPRAEPGCEMCQKPLPSDFRVGAKIGVPNASGHYCSESCYREAGAAMFVAGMDAAGRDNEVPDWVRGQASMTPRQLEVQEISRALYRQVLEQGGRLDAVLGRPGLAQLSSLTRADGVGPSGPPPLEKAQARQTMIRTPSGYQQAGEPRRHTGRRTPPTGPSAPAEAKTPPRRRRAYSLFQNLDMVRHGIIMQEILGPPKSMREL